MRVDSYNQNTPRPKIGSRWVWEIDLPHARALIEVVDVKWNGEEWLVESRTLLPNPTYPPTDQPTLINDLGRFWEACVPVLPKITGRMDQFTSHGPTHAPRGATDGD